MKSALLLFGLSVKVCFGGLSPITEHMDFRWEYREEAWDLELRTSDFTVDPNQDPTAVFRADEAFLVLSDRPYVVGQPQVSGARHVRPADSRFGFIGAPPGEPVWIAVQGSPGDGEAWPGFDNNQSAGTFGSYTPADPRVFQGSGLPWIRISLVGYLPPHGKSSEFSMWIFDTSTQSPKIWMSTFEPPVSGNHFYYPSGGHEHMAWGFTATGIHRLTLQASAYLGPGATNPTGPSDPYTVTFAVGTVARWQATWFEAAELDDPAISGLDADPDADGLTNLVEYAFGTHPRLGGPVPVGQGLGLPSFSLVEDGGVLYETLTYPRRRAGERLQPEVYEAEFSENPGSGWDGTGVTTTAEDFPPPLEHLNADWERVTSRRQAGPSGHGFARVAVTAGDGF